MFRPALPGAGSAALALLAAVCWGGGDFSGGMGVKAAGGSPRAALKVIAAGHGISFAGLLLTLLYLHAGLPRGAPVLWGLGAGVTAALSLMAFYVALARGAMGASAAISGLLAAAIPAGVGIALDGAPGIRQWIGFALAGAAIWMIAAAPQVPAEPVATSEALPHRAANRALVLLALGSGVGFGVYFAALRFANSLGILQPLALARSGSVTTCLLLLLFLQRGRSHGNTADDFPATMNRRAWLWALGIATLDTGGNLLFIAATRTGRLDVASVLAALYPASTILLAAALLKERPSRNQLVGMCVAVAAVVMITL